MLEFFTDPVLRGPTLGTMLMCFAASMVGVLVFIRKRSLLGEALSHATYPGVTLAAFLASLFHLEKALPMMILGGAFLFALLAFWVIDCLQTRFKIYADAALCFVLATFFGMGVLLASYLQVTHIQEYRQIQVYLYGQAATMGDHHIWLYGFFSLLMIATFLMFYREFQVISFDKQFGTSLGLRVWLAEIVIFLLVALAIVIGIRSVGVVLMSAMLIAPAIGARQWTHHFSSMLILAGFFGILSGFLGNYFSVKFSTQFASLFPGNRFSFPTGPSIVLVASFIAIFSLFFAPKRGLVIRYCRFILFRIHRMEENVLKTLWRYESTEQKPLFYKELPKILGSFPFTFFLIMIRLRLKRWIKKEASGSYILTPTGAARGRRIIRLHRLWEVYLFDYLGIGAEKVHKSAEEIEHILTEDLEKQLTLLLSNPQHDPHHQPIPQHEEGYV